MNLRDVTACVLVKNEINYIGHILSPLVKKFGEVLVYDTGSTDGTIDVAKSMGANVVEKGGSSEYAIGSFRTEMNRVASCSWTMIVDGDELYPLEMIEEIEGLPIPEGKKLGFTRMCSVDWEDGSYVQKDDMFNRVAFHPKGSTYKGEYPFESPHLFENPANYFYLDTKLCAWHLHRLNRSPIDQEVYRRKEKQFQYSMQDKVIPSIGRIELPLDGRFPDPYVKKA